MWSDVASAHHSFHHPDLNMLVVLLGHYRIGQGILVTAVLSLVLVGTVLTVDSYIWKIIRRPLAHYFLTVPFCIAAAASAYFGTICVPLLKRLKAHQVFRIEGPAAHQSKVGTPTMGGLYFVPIGVGVARLVTGSWPNELWGVCVATLAFGAIGFVDDGLAFWRKHNYGMPGSLKFWLQVCCCMLLVALSSISLAHIACKRKTSLFNFTTES